MDAIKVNIDREKCQISVMNTGKGIPVEMHKKEGIMIPELIFGNLSVQSLRAVADNRLTSSNYDDDQKKLTGGRNGYGAKLANIYSSEFSESTAYPELTISRRDGRQS
jgi:DNA topoisomerase-2